MSDTTRETIAELDIDNSKALQSLAAVKKSFKEAGDAAAGTAEQVGKVEAATSKAAGALSQANTTTETTTKRLRENDGEWKRLERSIAGSASAVERYTALQRQADNALATGRLNAVQHAQAMGMLGEKYLGTGREVATLNDELRNFAQVANNGYLRAMAMVAGFAAVTAGIRTMASEAAEAKLTMDRMTGALNVATGSPSASADELKWLKETVKSLGLDFRETGQEFAKFLAAAKGTALAGDPARAAFTGVAEAAAALKLSSEQTSGALNALQQMISKGKVQAEELRGQLGERIPGAFAMAARAMGVTTAELDKMLAAGQITAGDLLPKLAAELHRTFGPQAKESAEGLQGQLNRLNNAVFEFKAAVGEAMAPALGKAAKDLEGMATGADSAAKSLGTGLGTAISTGVTVLKAANDNVNLLAGGLAALTAVQLGRWAMAAAEGMTALNVAMLRNPLALIAMAAAAATVALLEWRDAANKATKEQQQQAAATEAYQKALQLAGITVNNHGAALSDLSASERDQAKATLEAAVALDRKTLALKEYQLAAAQDQVAELRTKLPPPMDEKLKAAGAEPLRAPGVEQAIDTAEGKIADLSAGISILRDRIAQGEEGIKNLGNAATAAAPQVQGYADAVAAAAAETAKLRQGQAQAGAKFFTNERDLQKEVDALKKGEEAYASYQREKVRSEAYNTAYNLSIRSGLEVIEATSEGHRIATLALEKYDLALKRSQQQQADRQALKDERAYDRTTDALEREVEARRRLAVATLSGSKALDEANIQSRLATELSRARVDAGSNEASTIEALVREEAKWTKVTNAANLVKQTIEAGQTPLERFQDKFKEIAESVKFLQENGIGLSASQIDALNRGIQEMTPAFQELKDMAGDMDEFPAEIADDPEMITLFMEAVR